MRLSMAVTALALSALMPAAAAAASEESGDPLDSARWAEMRKAFLANVPVRFDPRVQVIAPADAEDPMQVPVTVDATGLADVREVVVFADFNPIVEVLRFYPEGASAYLGFRVKLQQSTPVRAAARTGDGVWRVGGTWVNTVGGGCTAPTATSAGNDWQRRLNEVSARQWSEGPLAGRLRMKIMHPMDTGLVAGIPAFHLQDIRVADADGRPQMRIQAAEPVSENPVFTLQRANGGRLLASGRDNNGNAFRVWIEP